MPRSRSLEQERKLFDDDARAYCDYLRVHHPEHFMESTPQGKQREITMASLALVHERRPEVQYFNELLVQFYRKGTTQIQRVVPDNMVVIHPDPIEAGTSFSMPLQPVGLFWTLEYVSKNNKRKDYEDSFQKYERDLRVPYYLTFYPDNEEMTLYRLGSRKRYVSVKPNGAGRLALPELELDVGLLDGWMRYWFRGELLPLPGALLRELDKERQRNTELQQRLQSVEQQMAQMRADLDQLRAERKSG